MSKKEDDTSSNMPFVFFDGFAQWTCSRRSKETSFRNLIAIGVIKIKDVVNNIFSHVAYITGQGLEGSNIQVSLKE